MSAREPLRELVFAALVDMTSDHVWLEDAADALAPLVAELRAEAWDEGRAAGRIEETTRDVHGNWFRPRPTNPYREAR